MAQRLEPGMDTRPSDSTCPPVPCSAAQAGPSICSFLRRERFWLYVPGTKNSPGTAGLSFLLLLVLQAQAQRPLYPVEVLGYEGGSLGRVRILGPFIRVRRCSPKDR